MYRIAVPHPMLSPYIESYWSVRAGEAPFRLSVNAFVDARADLVFNYGSPYIHRIAGGAPERYGGAHLHAQRSRPIVIDQARGVHSVGLRFRLGGLARFLAIPVCELSDLVVETPTAFGRTVAELEGRLFDAGDDFDQQGRLLDSFFLQRLRPAPSTALFLAVADMIAANPGGLRLARLTAAAGHSIRTIGRAFRLNLGYSPKFYARVARFQRALRLLRNRETLDLADVALSCGFYDQAHFTNEIRLLSGSPPLELRRRPAPDTDFSPNDVRYFQDL